jgi:hypothetical protein
VPSLAVYAALFRSTETGRQPLANGGRIEPGDPLFLELESPEQVHVYVLDEDRTGSVFVLFPLAGTDLANPLPPGLRHRLPGRRGGTALGWQVTSAGGRETFLLLASRAPPTGIDSTLASSRHAEEGRPVIYAELTLAVLRTLRGVGGVTVDPALPDDPAGARLMALARRLARQAGQDGLWMRVFELENPAP